MRNRIRLSVTRLLLAAVLMALTGAGPATMPALDVDALLQEARAGDASAQFKLGLMYSIGWGVPKDEKLAVEWYRKAADQGDADAQFNLGVMYDNGRGVPKDDVSAYTWLNIAAVSGHADAAKLRDIVGRGMTREQVAEAQKLSREYSAQRQSQ